MRTGAYAQRKTGELPKLIFAVTILPGRPLIEYRRQRMLGLNDPLFYFNYSVGFYSVMYGVEALGVSRMLRSGIIDSRNLKFNGKLIIPLSLGS